MKTTTTQIDWRATLTEALNAPGALGTTYTRFYNYSFLNQVRLMMQGTNEPVATYKLWVELGRQVRKGTKAKVVLAPNLPLRGDAVVQQLRTMLTSYGLTPAEAEGLIAAWTPQFFQTEGRRFLLRMSAADYDWQCPMQVRPKPTEVVRLGLVLTEFDAGAGKAGAR